MRKKTTMFLFALCFVLPFLTASADTKKGPRATVLTLIALPLRMLTVTDGKIIQMQVDHHISLEIQPQARLRTGKELQVLAMIIT
jgi:hypothetical protein